MPLESSSDPGRRQKNFISTVILLAVFAAAASAGFYFFIYKKHMPSPEKPEAPPQVKLDMPAAAAPSGPRVNLVLKSGRTFEGILSRKTDEGYWVFIEGTGEVFFSHAEIAKASEEPQPSVDSGIQQEG